MSDRSAKILINVTKIMLLAAVVVYLVVKINYRLLWGYLSHMNAGYFLAGVLCFISGMIFNIFKWKFLVSRYVPMSFREAATSMMAGYTLSILTPARLGEMGRCFFVSKLEKRKTISLVGIDKMFNLSITTFLGIFFLQFIPLSYPLPVKIAVYFFSAVLLTFIILYTRYPKTLYHLLSRIPFLYKGKGEEFLIAVEDSNKKDNIVLFLMTITMYVCYLAEFVFFSLSLKAGTFLVALNGYVISLFLKTALPLTVADWGIKEVSLMEFYEFFGHSSEIALGAALFIYFFNILLPALIGLFPVMKFKKGDISHGKE